MLANILEILGRKESLSMAQLAHEVGYSVRETESALEQMEHMGYISRELFGQGCSANCDADRCSGHCEGCGFVSSETFSVWALSERGQTLLNSKTK
ncbi:winged helix-turn-helix domain-containing protein [Desulfosporosinus sp. Sb-LF]|uniref:winged helix-turn-helix domain-containing protein n=1 Tax=Desulfosporosinus sp. Sb-LF TaxID=2560027 RepID=UPI00107F7686|nr:winged helix-turn-helix domain-containing protein [Desulfosporosinus sp. Sb-LF]TGE32297.1 winged helix-turn-helix domain-containing protein [Desulfosporosinus sp. Sb-LF]